MLEMAKKDIMPAAMKYVKFISETINALSKAAPFAKADAEQDLLKDMTTWTSDLYTEIKKLTDDIAKISTYDDVLKRACYLRDVIVADMKELRKTADKMEEVMPPEIYPYPTYGDLLYSVH